MAEQRSGCLVTCACKTLTAERHKRAGHALLSRAAMRKPLLTNALLCELEKDRHHSQHSGPLHTLGAKRMHSPSAQLSKGFCARLHDVSTKGHPW